MDKTNDQEVATEAHAYSPGLKVKRKERIRVLRKLPLPGKVIVKVGDIVDYNTGIAEMRLPGKPFIIKAAGILNIESEELEQYMVKKEGDSVKENEVIAKCITMFGMIKKFVNSPCDGIIESVSPTTGRITVRTPSEALQINAYIPGKIVEVIENEGAVIENEAAFIQGIFGVGGENHGKLVLVADSPSDILTIEKLKPEHKGCILVTGSLVTGDALKKAMTDGVTGIVSGGIKEEDLTNFIGHSIGVAITGEEEISLTLIITEGFGKINMSTRTFTLFKEFDSHLAHINGATQIRAGVLRPEIIIPIKSSLEVKDTDTVTGMKPGTPVRVIQTPYFGECGVVASLPVNLVKVETEADVRVVEVLLDNGKKILIPRANVEIIEE